MIIYGVALLSLCTLAGLFIGEILGVLLGVPANVGGVGIAMLLLIFVGSYLGKRGLLSAKTEQGVEFWSAVYIPIVVAMAAQQNVLGALSGGPAAILAGIAAVAVAFALVPLLDRFGRKKSRRPPAVETAHQRAGVSAMFESLNKIINGYGLISGFAIIGVTMAVSYWLSARLTRGRLHGSAIAIFLGLVLSYVGGVATGGQKGLVDVPLMSGIGLLGGAMLRDFAIVATAFGVNVEELRRAGVSGVVSLFLGVGSSFVAGVAVAMAFGYTDAVSLTTIGAGAVTYIVGPVTGAALGASSEVMALSIAAGLVKAILVMVLTPFVAPYIGLNNPRTAVIFGGLMGTSSGVAGGLAATDPKLVPYGCLTAAFYTAIGCLLGPSLLYFSVRGLVG